MTWSVLLAALLCISLAPYSLRVWRGTAPFSPRAWRGRAPTQHPSYSPPGHGELVQDGKEDESRRILLGEKEPTRSQVPTRGILWVHHIPKTGGTAVNLHLVQFLQRRGQSRIRIPFLELWGGGTKKLTRDPSESDAMWRQRQEERVPRWCQKTLDAIENWLDNPSPNQPLLMVHHHIHCGGLLQLAPVIQHFRSKLEMQGGAMHVSCMLRQPIAQTVSHLNFQRRITPLQWEKALLEEPNFDNFQVRYLLYNAQIAYSGTRLREPYIDLGANLVENTGEEEEEGQSIVPEEYPPISGITGQHLVAALEYLENTFDYVGETEQHAEYLDELKAFIGQFVSTSGWPSQDTRANVQRKVEKKKDWRSSSPALQELLIRNTVYDAALYEEAMKLKKKKSAQVL
ncbi:unnamed protein product [Chrysoparadoxa australica]